MQKHEEGSLNNLTLILLANFAYGERATNQNTVNREFIG